MVGNMFGCYCFRIEEIWTWEGRACGSEAFIVHKQRPFVQVHSAAETADEGCSINERYDLLRLFWNEGGKLVLQYLLSYGRKQKNNSYVKRTMVKVNNLDVCIITALQWFGGKTVKETVKMNRLMYKKKFWKQWTRNCCGMSVTF